MRIGKYCLFLLLLFPLFTQAQKRLEIIHAGSLKFDETLGDGAKRLIGDVQFKHENVLMFCDSAYFFNDNSLEAFSHVHIQQHDTIHLYGDHLKYSGNDKKAIITNNVVVKKGDMKLYTDILNYDMGTSVGYYTTWGKIVNKDNELNSKQGHFFAKSNDMYFKNDVVLTHQKEKDKKPEFTINCDTMRYNTSSKVTYFYGPTKIKSDENLIYCEDGWYDTEKQLSRFSKNAYILTEEQKMIGDSVFYDGKNNIGKALHHVQITDTTHKVTITGDFAIHYELTDLSVVTGKALLIKAFEKDTLFLHGDTLKAIGESTTMKSAKKKEKGQTTKQNNNQKLFAYHKVKFLKKDIQGKCDSLMYSTNDSVLKLYGEPTIWSEANQLTADSIKIFTGEKSLKSMKLQSNGFIASEKDSVHYNQIRGKKMEGYFKDNELHLIKVMGNGQSIFYVEEDKKLKAVNRAESSNIDIHLKDDKINQIVFISKPEATLFPMDQVDPKEFKLKGFVWRGKDRPILLKDIFVW